ncbi:uncharacterized protein LOC107273335 isoform X1 [Cephus cinctus]|uniref:Uncharacterized protein LOC107273335 isoform X1 n=2 Tax=Cephus cinctus TaxID=211228 RepID=A0AAJ7CBZ8_CEPCN|nr:uncharacterized protein LOC107273335 isoform X1 [Cephus cinctus]
MVEPSTDTVNVAGEENIVHSAIDALIKEDARLKVETEKVMETKKKWKTQYFQLERSNSYLAVDINNEKKDASQLEEKIKLKTREISDREHEVFLETQCSMERRLKIIKDFEDNVIQLATKIQQAQNEYCSKNLKQDCETYCIRYKKYAEELQNLQTQLDIRKQRYDFNDRTKFDEGNLLINLQILKEILMDDSSLERATRSGMRLNQELNSKIKQTKRRLSNLSEK